jgi:exodeoxyribonuclease VII small subunit
MEERAERAMAKTFEESFGELGQIVERLQQGELPREETISLFERGMRLSFECERYLEEAGRRVEVLVEREDGRLETEEFGEADD